MHANCLRTFSIRKWSYKVIKNWLSEIFLPIIYSVFIDNDAVEGFNEYIKFIKYILHMSCKKKSEIGLDLKRYLNSGFDTISCVLMLFFSIVLTYYYGYTKKGKTQNIQKEKRRMIPIDF